jgi:hypothetical protein
VPVEAGREVCMLDQITHSPSENNPVSRSNGLADTTQTTTYSKREYVLEDFSQQAINRGQQKINYLITVVDEKIVEALKELSYAVAKLAGRDIDLKALDNAINQVSAATKEIAGPFPPGCGDGDDLSPV